MQGLKGGRNQDQTQSNKHNGRGEHSAYDFGLKLRQALQILEVYLFPNAPEDGPRGIRGSRRMLWKPSSHVDTLRRTTVARGDRDRCQCGQGDALEGGCEAQSDNRSLLPLSTEMHIPGLTPETASLAHLARCPGACSFSKQLVLMM